jgi:hypothetical protein
MSNYAQLYTALPCETGQKKIGVLCAGRDNQKQIIHVRNRAKPVHGTE